MKYRGEYKFRDYFNAGINRENGNCDESGVEVYDVKTDELLATIQGMTADDILDLPEKEFDKFIEDTIFW